MLFSSLLNHLVLSLIPYSILVNAWATDGTQFIVAVNRTQPITLAGKFIDLLTCCIVSFCFTLVSPQCGPFNGTNFTEVNTGVQFNATKWVFQTAYLGDLYNAQTGPSSHSVTRGLPMDQMVCVLTPLIDNFVNHYCIQERYHSRLSNFLQILVLVLVKETISVPARVTVTSGLRI